MNIELSNKIKNTRIILKVLAVVILIAGFIPAPHVFGLRAVKGVVELVSLVGWVITFVHLNKLQKANR